MLTTQQAADMLNVPHSFLIKLLDEGRIPYTQTGALRQVRLQDVLDYRERRDQEVRDALDEMARDAQETGTYF